MQLLGTRVSRARHERRGGDVSRRTHESGEELRKEKMGYVGTPMLFACAKEPAGGRRWLPCRRNVRSKRSSAKMPSLERSRQGALEL